MHDKALVDDEFHQPLGLPSPKCVKIRQILLLKVGVVSVGDVAIQYTVVSKESYVAVGDRLVQVVDVSQKQDGAWQDSALWDPACDWSRCSALVGSCLSGRP